MSSKQKNSLKCLAVGVSRLYHWVFYKTRNFSTSQLLNFSVAEWKTNIAQWRRQIGLPHPCGLEDSRLTTTWMQSLGWWGRVWGWTQSNGFLFFSIFNVSLRDFYRERKTKKALSYILQACSLSITMLKKWLSEMRMQTWFQRLREKGQKFRFWIANLLNPWLGSGGLFTVALRVLTWALSLITTCFCYS